MSESGYGAAFRPAARKRARPALTQDAIVEAALRILDAEGAQALTFRRLAGDLGVGVASLYWHVESREVLLDLAIDAVAADFYAQLIAQAKGSTPSSWRADLRFAAATMFEAFQQRRWAAAQQLQTADRGPNQLRVWDRLGRIFESAGFTDEQGFYGLSALLSYTLGYAVQDSVNSRSPLERGDYLQGMGEFLASLDPAEFPTLVRTVGIFASHDERKQFEAGLDLLLDGLEQQLDATRRGA
jgi:AcrR family transcriptional regulator